MKLGGPLAPVRAARLGLLVLAFAPGLASAELRRFHHQSPEGHLSALRPAEPAAAGAVLPGALPEFAVALASATIELLHFLDGNPPPADEFLPACISHVRKVTKGIDRSYTDVQLRTVLEHECSRDKQFTTVESGFKTQGVCVEFAKRLTGARMKELDDGSTEGYVAFCQAYAKHRGGAARLEGNATKAGSQKRTQSEEGSSKGRSHEGAASKAEAEAEAAGQKAAAGQEKPWPKDATEDEVRKLTYEEHISKGRSHERATYEAQKAVSAYHAAKAGGGENQKDAFPVWPVALVIGGIVAFVLAGLYLNNS